MEIDIRCNRLRRSGPWNLAWYCAIPPEHAPAGCRRCEWPARRRDRCDGVSLASTPASRAQPQKQSPAGKLQRPARRIALLDFWPGFYDNTDRWFSKDWFERNLKDVEIVETSQQPDVILFTFFGKEHQIHVKNGSRAKLVFYTGENVRPPIGKIPLCISFDHVNNVPSELHRRLPLWVFNKEVHEVIRMHEARLRGDVDSSVCKREGFCAWVASNPNMHNAKVRLQFVQALSAKYKLVACGGEVLNNVGGPVKDKLAFIKGYRFHICFENATHPGYCTEKLLHAFAAGCVPIYWGDPHVSKQGRKLSDFNPDALISAHDFEGPDQLIQHIQRVDSDPDLFASYLRKPILSDAWYQCLHNYPAFCKSFADLLFQDADKGTRPLQPTRPSDRCPTTK